MVTDLIAYLAIAAAGFFAVRHILRQLRSAAKGTCDCGGCGGCDAGGACTFRLEEPPIKKT